MNRALRIAVADDEPDMRDFYRRMLTNLGHQVITAAATGQELIEETKQRHADLIIADIRMPGIDGIDAIGQICRDDPIPSILVSAHHDSNLLDRVNTEYIMAYLIKPIQQADLAPAIAVAMNRFEQFQTLRNEANNLRQSLQDRKIIERAKGIIMKVAGIDEPTAFRRLQKMSSDKNRKLVEIAEMVVTAEEMVRTPDGK